MKPLHLVSNVPKFCGNELEARSQASKPVNSGGAGCCSSRSVRPQGFLTRLQMRQILALCRGIELPELSHFGCQDGIS